MTLMTASRSARLFAVAAACAALFAVIFIWFKPTTESPRSEVVADAPARIIWKTIEYRGVQIDIPSAWERLDMGDCEFQYERWAPPHSPPCRYEGGVAFYGSATFDPAHGPGVRRTDTSGAGIPTWGGYVYAGDYAVYASDTDRDLVQKVLDSAQVTGSKAPSRHR
jgi:hypothetical protein